MAKLTKRMKAIKAGVDSTKAYEINEAIAVLKQIATVGCSSKPITSLACTM